MHTIDQALSVVSSVLFVALAAVAVVQWLRRRDAAAGWIAVSFLSLGLIVTFGQLVPKHPHGFGPVLAQRIDLELLVLFPYLLYRFATAFRLPSVRLRRIVGSITIGLSIWTFALPHFPTSGEPRPPGFFVYLIAFLVHWTLLSIVVTGVRSS